MSNFCQKFTPKYCLSRKKISILTKRFVAQSQTQESNGPLSQVRVLDLSRVLAGPYCTMILGDLGAEILKIEHPQGGDDTRSWGPPFLKSESGSKESCYFLSVNRNKKSLCVNLKHEKGRLLVQDLARVSDVLVENYLPGKLESMGLGYKDISQIAPQLIYCSISGFGSEGPYKRRAGYDVIAASIGGLMHITGPEDGEPCKVGVAMTDLATGLYAHGAIMAALIERQKTGKGQKIDCNLLSTQVATLANLASNYINAGLEARRWGTAHASIVPYQSFRTKDGYMTIGCGNDPQFQHFCKIVGQPDLSLNERFITNADRVANRKILVEKITEVMSEKTNSEWNAIFSEAGAKFPFGPVNNLASVFADPQVQYNKSVVEMEHHTLGTVKQVNSAVKFSTSVNEPRTAPPTLGEHTVDTLKNTLNLSDKYINELLKSGTIK